MHYARVCRIYIIGWISVSDLEVGGLWITVPVLL